MSADESSSNEHSFHNQSNMETADESSSNEHSFHNQSNVETVDESSSNEHSFHNQSNVEPDPYPYAFDVVPTSFEHRENVDYQKWFANRQSDNFENQRTSGLVAAVTPNDANQNLPPIEPVEQQLANMIIPESVPLGMSRKLSIEKLTGELQQNRERLSLINEEADRDNENDDKEKADRDNENDDKEEADRDNENDDKEGDESSKNFSLVGDADGGMEVKESSEEGYNIVQKIDENLTKTEDDNVNRSVVKDVNRGNNYADREAQKENLGSSKRQATTKKPPVAYKASTMNRVGPQGSQTMNRMRTALAQVQQGANTFPRNKTYAQSRSNKPVTTGGTWTVKMGTVPQSPNLQTKIRAERRKQDQEGNIAEAAPPRMGNLAKANTKPERVPWRF